MFVLVLQTLELHRVVKAVCRLEPQPLAAVGSLSEVMFGSELIQLCRCYVKVIQLHNYSVVFFTFTALGILKYKHMVTGKIALSTQLVIRKAN